MPTPLLPNAPPMLVFAIVLACGLSFGTLAQRVRLPSITGQILAGVLLGHGGLHVVSEAGIDGLSTLTEFALGLMGVTVGTHLSVRRLRNAVARLGRLVALESTLIPALVTVGVLSLGYSWSTGLLFGTIAISTAPATIVALVRETRSKGVFSKTLIAAVALNNIACILLFESARVATHLSLESDGQSAFDLVWLPLKQLVEAAVLGTIAAFAVHYFARFNRRGELLASGALLAIVLTWGVASHLGVSPLLACLFIGLAQTNLTSDRSKLVDRLFSSFEPAILAVFFTLAGMELTLAHIGQVGSIAAVCFALRLAGKLAASWLAMRWAGAPDTITQNLGLALVPQAGVAIGLVILLEQDEAIQSSTGGVGHLFAGVILTVVLANEILGPVLTRLALTRSKEINRDRTRLIDFIHEENIETNFNADSMDDALVKLTDLLIRTHHLNTNVRESLLDSIRQREAEFSTCLGGGLAVPHGVLPSGKYMLGVLAISKHGLPFDTPDGKPINYMVLLATPEIQRSRHLQVLAAIAHSLGQDSRVQRSLLDAQSPAHAYQLLHDDESGSFNYFLDDDSRESQPAVADT